MEFTQIKFDKKKPTIDQELFDRYSGNRWLKINIGSKVATIENLKVIVIVYLIGFYTEKEEKRIIETAVSYQAIVQRENLSVTDEKIEVWLHIRKGLIGSLLKVNGSAPGIEDEILSKSKWNKETEKAYSDIVTAFS